MKRIILSGASGFLGTNIIKKALQQDIDVLALVLPGELQGVVPTMVIYDFLENGCAFNSDDVFINCLFPTNADGYKMADGLEILYRTIVRAHQSNAGAIINISSQSVYASKRTAPAREDDALCLETPYAVGKYSSEAFVNHVFRDRPHTNIRLSSLIGIGYNQRIVNRMADQALKGSELKVMGGMQRYGFLDVRDAAAGLIRVAQSDPANWKEAYNLGRKESYTLLEVAECICAEIRNKTGLTAGYTVTEGEDNRNSSVDPSRFMTEFGWSPEISLVETTSDIIDDLYKGAAE